MGEGIGDILGLGLLMGLVHVLTGPDHLSALATLSVGREPKAAALLGIKWGFGHSFGLLLVAIVFFVIGTQFDMSKISYWADVVVGFFMIVLGLWFVVCFVFVHCQISKFAKSQYIFIKKKK